MTEKEKRLVLDMRADGKSYKEIAGMIGVPEGSVKSFVSRYKKNDVQLCAQCKKVLPEGARQTQRFCSHKCRNDWWNSHLKELHGNTQRTYVCGVCGKRFSSYKNAKYCSRTCFYESRRSKS